MKTTVFRYLLSLVFLFAVLCMFGCDKEQVKIPTDTTIMPPESIPVLKVGLLQPPGYYPSFTRGAHLARDAINAAGGVNGMQLALAGRDELGDTLAASLTELVAVENIVGIIGPVFSSHAVTIDPSVHVPMLAGATDANRVTQTNDFIFLVGGSNVLHGELMASFAVETLKAETAAVILQDQDVYSAGIATAFDAQFEKLGGTIAGEAETYPAGATDFTEQLTAIKAADPDVLFLVSFAPEVPRIMAAAREMEIEAVLLVATARHGRP